MVELKDYECDKAPTNKGKCYACRKTILKGTPRLYYHDTMRKTINKIEGMNVKRLICYDCSLDYIRSRITTIGWYLSNQFKTKRKLLRMAKGKRAKALLLKSKMLDKITAE